MAEPPCPHRPTCPGCPLFGLPADRQLARKRARVEAALGRFPGLRSVPVEPCVPAPSPLGYRARLKLAVDRRAGRLAIGLLAPGSHEVVDAPACPVAHPALLRVVETLRGLLAEHPLEAVYLDLRRSSVSGEVHVTVVVRDGAPDRAAARLAEALTRARPEVVGVAVRRPGPGPALVAVSGRARHLLGKEHLWERVGDAKLRLSPGAFFQADPAAAERLHGVVRAWLGEPGLPRARHLVDLYAGTGAFAVALADLADRTTAVEAVPGAAADARASAEASGRPVTVVTVPAERFAAGLADDPPDRLVLDPPRRGADLRVLRGLGRAAPARAAYVSCDPETLARDLAVLETLGMSARRVVPVDLFSQTPELDAVALLEPSPRPRRPTVLARAGRTVVVDKPASLPTHPQGRGEPSVLAAARAGGLGDGLEAAHRLDVGTSGALVLSEGDDLRELGRAFASGGIDKTYLALVRGVPRKSGRVRERQGARREETRYRLREVVGGYGLVEVMPATGRRHQVRRHLARIGHPVLGDDRYGDPRANRFLAETCCLARPFLHLLRLRLATSGEDGEARSLVVEAPLAPELELVLERLVALRGGRAPEDQFS